MKSFERNSSILPSLLLLQGGCRPAQISPSVDVLGSYFPAWMVCAVSGLVLTLIAREILIAAKLHPYLRPALLVYLCMMVLFTLAVWLACFRN